MQSLFVVLCLLLLTLFLVDAADHHKHSHSRNGRLRRLRGKKGEGLNGFRKRRQIGRAYIPSGSSAYGYESRTTYERWLACENDPLCDRRTLDEWYMLYPYGKNFWDDKLLGMINRETQINLGFDMPFYGFRFNYTMIYPNGFISFAMPVYIQPPYDFPNPRWPKERDHSFIAPFYADVAFQYVGSTEISNVWYRTVHRPRLVNEGWLPNNPDLTGGGVYQQQSSYNYGGGQQPAQMNYNPYGGGGQSPFYPNNQGGTYGTGGNVNMPLRKKRQIPLGNQVGNIIDEPLLDNITRDIQEGIVGANGWRAEHAVIVTWERVAYGGAPKMVVVSQFEQYLKWQNTFQLILASDMIRTYAMFNYARLNWTTSAAAGGLNGFGGKQAAMVGFNGGNGTGWTRMPYSGEGRVWQLAYFSNVLTPGRWVYRIDEQIVPGGCSNESIGYIVTAPTGGNMVGGINVNVSGMCLRDGDYVKVVFDEWPVDCRILNRIRARCVMPTRFRKTGLVTLRMSRDGGQSYPYVGWFYVCKRVIPCQINWVGNPTI